MIFPFRNKSKFIVTIMLEPWLSTVDLQPNEVAELRGNFGNDLERLEFDFISAEKMVIWCPEDTEIIKILE